MKKVKAVSNEIADNNLLRIRIFKGILLSLITFSVVYAYLIGSIVFNGLAKKSLENNVRELVNNVGQLELSYLTLSNSIDKDLAISLGYVDAHNSFIVTRTIDRVAIK